MRRLIYFWLKLEVAVIVMLGTGKFPNFLGKNSVPKKRDRERRPLQALNLSATTASCRSPFLTHVGFYAPSFIVPIVNVNENVSQRYI